MKQIYANYDDEGIYVYQAFKREIVDAALEKGTFGEGFSLERMTWIKPSFAWMLYRSRYGTKPNQQAILKIKVCHEGFEEILRCAVPTTYEEDVFSSKREWRDQLKNSCVRYQWDPDRDLGLQKLRRRAIQLGIRGYMVDHYVNKWILHLEDVTSLAHKIKKVFRTKKSARTEVLPEVPQEVIYEVPQDIGKQLGLKFS
ncbi:DUF4291 domain-containing protein [Candidatus Uabimicrobium amorphum]|uniref:DUF4291 domain-containing protein n=1 Tax=Uabimicrobium amorphum TaxID=2596890 RepID=A0A5S9IT01_UABAM|nr:DUF4291 domain-containing protein [Candidatus Uabimicrobium amorphum]BBM87559.1 hypothetical protein UABAM_05971 [Candidatus Uabimicrobium amorphum]